MPNSRFSLLSVVLFAVTPFIALTPLASHAQINTDWRKLQDPSPPIRADAMHGPFPARGGEAGGFPASNVTLLAWLPLNQFPNNQASGNDCWGYVSPSGREYAILGLQSGFSILEVTNPVYPVQIGFVPGNGSLWRDVKVIGHYAYGVSEGGLGIQVIDLGQVDDGIVTHVKNKTQQGHSRTHNIVANPDSGYLYLVGANIQNGGLVAVSTANPEDPTIVGAWGQMYVHDAQVVSYTSGPYAGREIAFCLSGFNGGSGQTGLRIVDVTNKNNMFTISTVSWAGARYSHQGWLSQDRRYFYINDELDEGTSVNVTTTRFFDVSDLGNPTFEGTFTTGLESTDHNLYIVGTTAYEANYMSGLRVFDVTDPRNAQEIAYLDTSPTQDQPGYHGAWSNYPFFPSGTILISDIERGLFILRVGEAQLGFEFPNGLPSQIRPGLPATLVANIIQDGATLDPDSVELVLVTGGGQTTLPMTANGQGGFTVELPEGECFDVYEYWFTARDTSGLTYMEPFNAPVDGGFETRVATGTDATFEDDFDADQGWIVDNSRASSGGWARAQPQAANSIEPETDADGSGFAYLTGATPGESLVGGPITLTSPRFDLEAAPHSDIHYAVWYDVDGILVGPLNVEISNDDGLTWTLVATHPRGSYWVSADVLASDFITPTDSVRLRFRANNSAGSALVEAGVDDFHLTTPVCDPCVADYNGDGTVDTRDFLAFFNDYTGATNEGDPDLNGDGVVNTLDVLLYLNLYAAGCD